MENSLLDQDLKAGASEEESIFDQALKAGASEIDAGKFTNIYQIDALKTRKVTCKQALKFDKQLWMNLNALEVNGVTFQQASLINSDSQAYALERGIPFERAINFKSYKDVINYCRKQNTETFPPIIEEKTFEASTSQEVISLYERRSIITRKNLNSKTSNKNAQTTQPSLSNNIIHNSSGQSTNNVEEVQTHTALSNEEDYSDMPPLELIDYSASNNVDNNSANINNNVANVGVTINTITNGSTVQNYGEINNNVGGSFINPDFLS